MERYITKLIPLPYRMFQSTVTEEELAALDQTLNQYAEAGWELAAYTYLGGQNEVERGLLVTFKKQEAHHV